MPATKYTVSILNSRLREITTDWIHGLSGHSVSWTWFKIPFITLLLRALILNKGQHLPLQVNSVPVPSSPQYIWIFPFPAANGFYVL